MFFADCHKHNKYSKYDKDLACRIPKSIALDDDDPKTLELADEMRQFYFNGQTITDKMKLQMSNLLGDYEFILELQLLTEIYARRQLK